MADPRCDFPKCTAGYDVPMVECDGVDCEALLHFDCCKAWRAHAGESSDGKDPMCLECLEEYDVDKEHVPPAVSSQAIVPLQVSDGVTTGVVEPPATTGSRAVSAVRWPFDKYDTLEMAPLPGATLLPDGGRVLVMLLNDVSAGLMQLDGLKWAAWPAVDIDARATVVALEELPIQACTIRRLLFDVPKANTIPGKGGLMALPSGFMCGGLHLGFRSGPVVPVCW